MEASSEFRVCDSIYNSAALMCSLLTVQCCSVAKTTGSLLTDLLSRYSENINVAIRMWRPTGDQATSPILTQMFPEMQPWWSTIDLMAMAAVAGPSKRFCTHCCRALWACQSRAAAPALRRAVAKYDSQPLHGRSVQRCLPSLAQRTFSSTAAVHAAKRAPGKVVSIDMEQFPPERIR